MKTKQKRLIPKTHKHRVEDGVSLRKHTDAQLPGEWKTSDTSEQGENQQREGHQNSSVGGKWEDTKEHTQVEQSGDEQNTKESVHPGTLQTMHQMSEQTLTTACDTQTDKTEIEAEVLQ